MNPLAAALGLLFVPSFGASVVDTFNALGPDAVFGPGCGDGNGNLTVQAPAHSRGGNSVKVLETDASRVTLMAEFVKGSVRSVHLSLPASQHQSAARCREGLARYGQGAISQQGYGNMVIFERAAKPIANTEARYRALYRPLRAECRVMLTIAQA